MNADPSPIRFGWAFCIVRIPSSSFNSPDGDGAGRDGLRDRIKEAKLPCGSRDYAKKTIRGLGESLYDSTDPTDLPNADERLNRTAHFLTYFRLQFGGSSQKNTNTMKKVPLEVSKTMTEFLGSPLSATTWQLESQHDRNRRPAFSCTTNVKQDPHWAVFFDDANHVICVSPEPVDRLNDKESCPYQAAINKTLAILINSDFAHEAGFVAHLKALCEAREKSKERLRPIAFEEL